MKQEEAELTEITSLFPLSTLFSKEPATYPLFTPAPGVTREVIGAPIEDHQTQMLSLIILLNIPLGLVINSHALKLQVDRRRIEIESFPAPIRCEVAEGAEQTEQYFSVGSVSSCSKNPPRD